MIFHSFGSEGMENKLSAAGITPSPALCKLNIALFVFVTAFIFGCRTHFNTEKAGCQDIFLFFCDFLNTSHTLRYIKHRFYAFVQKKFLPAILIALGAEYLTSHTLAASAAYSFIAALFAKRGQNIFSV